MADVLDVDVFIERSRSLPVLDVRTPAEYANGHIPGAVNLPIFSDDERADIGTAYHQESRDKAIMRGLEAVGPKLPSLVRRARAMISSSADGGSGGAPAGTITQSRGDAPQDATARPALVHCWRGGMRSEAMAWLLEFADLAVDRLDGGYKSFRRYVLESFELKRNVRILSGKTGSGKTAILKELDRRGAQVIDLEGLARHRGSVFGGLGRPDQPRQQQFENELALQWRQLDPQRPVWLEDESRRIGGLNIPAGIWEQMTGAPTSVIDVPINHRIDRLVRLYGETDSEELKDAVRLVEKRLGGFRTKQTLQAIEEGDFAAACRHLLYYYDRAYEHGLSKRDDARIRHVKMDGHFGPDEDVGPAGDLAHDDPENHFEHPGNASSFISSLDNVFFS